MSFSYLEGYKRGAINASITYSNNYESIYVRESVGKSYRDALISNRVA
jgi:hypothetical protein